LNEGIGSDKGNASSALAIFLKFTAALSFFKKMAPALDFTAFKTAGIQSSYLTEQSEQTRKKSIGWDAYFKAHMMTESELDRMNYFSRITGASQALQALRYSYQDEITGAEDRSSVVRMNSDLNDYTRMLVVLSVCMAIMILCVEGRRRIYGFVGSLATKDCSG
jgi:hypothetical protein